MRVVHTYLVGRQNALDPKRGEIRAQLYHLSRIFCRVRKSPMRMQLKSSCSANTASAMSIILSVIEFLRCCTAIGCRNFLLWKLLRHFSLLSHKSPRRPLQLLHLSICQFSSENTSCPEYPSKDTSLHSIRESQAPSDSESAPPEGPQFSALGD